MTSNLKRALSNLDHNIRIVNIYPHQFTQAKIDHMYTAGVQAVELAGGFAFDAAFTTKPPAEQWDVFAAARKAYLEKFNSIPQVLSEFKIDPKDIIFKYVVETDAVGIDCHQWMSSGYQNEYAVKTSVRRSGVVAAVRENDRVTVIWSLCNPVDEFHKASGIRQALKNYESGKFNKIPHRVANLMIYEIDNMAEAAKHRFKTENIVIGGGRNGIVS